MDKLLYVLWRPEGVSPGAFRDAIVGPVAARLAALGVRHAEASLADEHVADLARVRIAHTEPPVAGILSFRLDAAARADAEAALGEHAARHAGYRVTESVPRPNRAHPERPGRRTEGTNMVALLERPARLAREEWLDLWLERHREVALETQCTFRYVRNVVVRPLGDGAPPWEGIVEEGFPTEAVTDPMRWYRADGDPERLRRNMDRMLDSVRAFLDLDRIESHPLSHYPLVR